MREARKGTLLLSVLNHNGSQLGKLLIIKLLSVCCVRTLWYLLCWYSGVGYG